MKIREVLVGTWSVGELPVGGLRWSGASALRACLLLPAFVSRISLNLHSNSPTPPDQVWVAPSTYSLQDVHLTRVPSTSEDQERVILCILCVKMSSQEEHQSRLPPSLGPGARPVKAGEGEAPGSILKEVSEIRSHYSVTVEPSILNIGYQLRGVPRYYRIPFESMPLGGLSKWILYGGSGRTTVSGTLVIDAIRGAENMAGRPLTQTEAEGFAFYSSKRTLYSFAGTFFGFGGGYAMAWLGKDKMKFPLMKPKPLERYDAFPNAYLPILRGQYARLMWQITRGNVYAAIGLLLAQPLFASLGDTTMMVGLYRDDRTKDVLKDMKGAFDRINSNRVRSAPGGVAGPQPQTQRDDGPYVEPESREFSNSEGYLSEEYPGGQDFSSDRAYADGTTDSSMLTESTTAQRQSKQSSPAAYGQKPIPTPKPQDSSSTGSDFFFDDASPTAGNGLDTTTPAPYKPAGSAWARIRRGIAGQGDGGRGASPESTNQGHGRDEPSRSLPGRGFESQSNGPLFSTGEEERQLARAQAQKEFDEMLERERRESGSGDYAKGTYAVETGQENIKESVWERRRRGG